MRLREFTAEDLDELAAMVAAVRSRKEAAAWIDRNLAHYREHGYGFWLNFALTRIVALVPPANAASRRVAEKIGMREERTSVVEGSPYAVYVLERVTRSLPGNRETT